MNDSISLGLDFLIPHHYHTPPKINIDTKNDVGERYLLSDMAILGIYVKFQEGI